MPVYPPEMLDDVNKKKKGDDMADFAVGSYWEEMLPDVDVPEPRNDEFPTAHAPTIPEDEAKNQPRPKQGFSRQFQRPAFKGKAKGGPRKEFLRRHSLTKDSTPSEFVEAFFPMFKNSELDENGDPMMSMEYLTSNLNLRAAIALAGDATYDDWGGNFKVKETRQHLGLLIINGLSPSPTLEMKFDCNDNANFNHFVSENRGDNATR